MRLSAPSHVQITFTKDDDLPASIDRLWGATTNPIFVYSENWKPSYVRAIEETLAAIAPEKTRLLQNTFLVPTGGTSGKIKIAVLHKEALQNSVHAVQTHFALSEIHSLCTLPLYHVSGLLSCLRSHLSGGKFLRYDYQQMKENRFPEVSGFCLSLVPTQLHFLLQNCAGALPFLRSQSQVFLGGAPASPTLLQRAWDEKIPLAPVYGMTETCAMIASARPQSLIEGKLFYTPFSGVSVRASVEGTLQIACPSLFSGYVPEATARLSSFQTSDLVTFQKETFAILGRADDVIISGGKKIFPQEVAQQIQTLLPIDDLLLRGEPDPTWGQKLVAYYVSREGLVPEKLTTILKTKLENFQIPKEWHLVPALPYDEKGKIKTP